MTSHAFPLAASSAKTDLRGLFVLLVEDDYLVATALADTLQQAGASIVGPFGWENQITPAILEASIDRALIDINLHGKDSYVAIDAMLRRNIKVVILTSYSPELIPAPYAACQILTKPARLDAIIEALAS